MSNITKERVAEFIKNPLDNGLTRGEQMELARIALASLEAEPVAFRSKLQPPYAGSERWDYTDHRQPDAFELENCFIERLYTAPPAPVVVPEPIKRNDADGWWMYKGRRVGGGCAEWYNRALDDCRAAMLQSFGNSEQLNSPVIPDGWVLVPEEPTHEMLEAGDEQFGTYDVYRRMIAASPQQEVKP